MSRNTAAGLSAILTRTKQTIKELLLNNLVLWLFTAMTILFNHRPRLNQYLRHGDGYFTFTLGFKTETASVDRAIQVAGGRMRVLRRTPPEAAMADPDSYRGLLVRISGYNACFVTLNREMQIELIKRAEYGLEAAG